MSVIWPFLLYTFICFVVAYILVEYGQRYLYDEVTPYVGLKVLGGAAIMGAILTWTRSSFATMFTDDIPFTALMALAWAGVFILVFRFQPLHGALFALAAVLLLPGLASIAVEGTMRPRVNPATVSQGRAKPIRRALGAPAPAADATTAPASK